MAIGIQVSGCSYDDPCAAKLVGCPLGVGGNGGTGGDGGTGGIVPPPAGCDPEIAKGGVDEGCGVFVSVNGANSAEGTKLEPLKSINKAVDLSVRNGTKRVYLCAGDEPFEEAVTVPAGVTVYGGLNCAANWEWNRARKTTLTAPQGEVPLTLRAAGGSVQVEDLHVKAQPVVIDNPDDTEKYGKSSIAVIADGGSGESDSGSVGLARCTLEADEAAPGAPGESPDSQRARSQR
ncbi:hypothetical protein BE20_02430 [Sorangium cellulosum]|nr:hypothetical protein BE20_02430 [Sorangium cellulosum]